MNRAKNNVRKNQQAKVGLAAKLVAVFCACFLLMTSGCNQIQSPKAEPFVGEVAPPRRQEFRWSNGKMPKSFDPAFASASPETDFVRALYEGLTDLNSKNLEPVPAIAVKWTASEDFKTWTFQLRQNAKWSNGESVTAKDFVRSWKRLTELGEKVGQRDLLKNIVGMDTKNALPVFANEELDRLSETLESSGFSNNENQTLSNSNTAANNVLQNSPAAKQKSSGNQQPRNVETQNLPKNDADFGIEAIDDFTLKVTLIQPDKEFPSLVAHPIFRPVFGEGKDLESLNVNTITNGAFKIAEIEKAGIVLERSPNYWNKETVQLELVRFVPAENAESVLADYRAGKIDAITNANLEPLVLKLLTPYDDFRRTKHSALNFYEFNLNQTPFNDRRIREALAVAIERERLTQGDMDGATEPALSFLPFETEEKLSQDTEKAKKLFAEAGFPDGAKFPKIRLLINRNNVQQKIARSIAAMWKKNLKIETEIIVKDQADFENAAQMGDFDIIRRGMVLPTTDETANMLNMFPADRKYAKSPKTEESAENQILNNKTAESELDFSELENPAQENNVAETMENLDIPVILTEEEAILHLPAIPLYFPTSYSLVKPYVHGFEMNELDAVSLKDVRIDSNWQPSGAKNLSNGNS